MRWAAFLIVLLVAARSGPGLADAGRTQPIAWRISLENAPDHVQVQAVRQFARRFEKLADGRVSVRVFDNARLYRDSDLPQALSLDRIEMGVPGVWQLDRFVPDFGLFLLPMFYGRAPDVTHAVADGPVGQSLDNALEERLNVVVPGRWIDLGPAHIFTFGRPVRRRQDFAGMRLRVAGGVANEMRLQRFGATAVRVAWPDLPEAIDRGNLDGLLTSYVTIESAPFARRVRYVYEDSAYFPQYVPMVSRSAWRRLGPDLRRALAQAWDDGVEAARTAAAAAQADARARLMAGGLTVVTVHPDDIAANRALLDTVQDAIVDATHITPSLADSLQYRFQNAEIDP